jgi:hypothetical protein
MSEAENFSNDSVDEQLEALDQYSIADLRRAAKIMKIQAARDWDKLDFIAAIKRKQETSYTGLVFDSEKAPKPGYSRVLVHRDPTPGHKNNSVHVAVNGAIVGIPRGIEVDIPIPFVEALANAITTTVEMSSEATRDNPSGIYTDQRRTSYPFQVIATTPGEWTNTNDNRGSGYKERKLFFDRYGHWPTHGELQEWKKAKLNQEARNGTL